MGFFDCLFVFVLGFLGGVCLFRGGGIRNGFFCVLLMVFLFFFDF